MSGKRVFLHLFTTDLRLSDNPILHLANAKTASHYLPVYVFNEQALDLSAVPGFKYGANVQQPKGRSRTSGLWRSANLKIKFLVESVLDLKKNLKKRNSDLLVGFGRPEVVVHGIVKSLLDKGDQVQGVYMQREVTTEEVVYGTKLRDALQKLDIPFHLIDGGRTLVHPDDLPFKATDTPDIYTNFRKAVEGLNSEMIRKPLPVPNQILPRPDVSLEPQYRGQGDLLAALLKPLQDEPALGAQGSPDGLTAFPFSGGETAGQDRLNDYLGQPGTGGGWQGGDKAKTYKDTRNGLVGEAFSTKFSAWLSVGALSAREIGWRTRQLHDHLHDKGAEKNVYWIQFELLWRDFFYFTTLKYSQPSSSSPCPSTLYNLAGFAEKMKPTPKGAEDASGWKSFDLSDENDLARRWCDGRTGVPFIDAAMRELAITGWMSNRSRQNVASFLTKDLYIDWRVGAEFFEMHLIDYDTCSNWGNWQYQAGVGNDPRASRQFNPIKQAADYDPNAEYVRMWLPELKDVPIDFVQTPWRLPNDQHHLLGNYPSRPVIEQQQWKKHYSAAAGGGRGGGGGGGGNRGRGGRGGRGQGRGGRPHGKARADAHREKMQGNDH